MSVSDIEVAAKWFKREPDERFIDLSRTAQIALARGYFKKSEVFEICRWKSHRRAGLSLLNSDDQVRTTTSRAFGAKDERTRIEQLILLKGVGIPTASALLATTDPARYGVIDIRAWQLFFTAGIVNRNKGGKNLSVAHWLAYIEALRGIALRVNSTPRLVERSLYEAHKQSQETPLYGEGGNQTSGLQRGYANRSCRRC